VKMMAGSKECQDDSYFVVEWSINPRPKETNKFFFPNKAEARAFADTKNQSGIFIWFGEYVRYKHKGDLWKEEFIFTWASKSVQESSEFENLPNVENRLFGWLTYDYNQL
jgi:hypothetical protein